MTKICTVCKLEKDIKEFGLHYGKPRPDCKSCCNAYQKDYYQRNLDKCRKQSREQAARDRTDPEKRLRMLEIQKKSWEKGGRERQQRYLDKLKETDFFKWKARKSYIWLNENELRNLWENQKGLCGLTGRALDATAELDHIIPKSRGGKNTLENARWLCKEANQCKRNLLDDEFVELCKEILEYISNSAKNADSTQGE